MPTIEQLTVAARRLYNGHWSDSRQIAIDKHPGLIRHEDGEHSGTWVDCAVFVPDADALEVKS